MLRCWKVDKEVKAIAFSPNGTRIAVGFGSTLQVWNSQTGDTVIGPFMVGIHTLNITFSPDNSSIAHAGLFDHIIWVRDSQNGGVIHALELEYTIEHSCIGYSPDGRYIVSGCNQSVQLWDAQNGQMILGPLQAHTGGINSITFCPDGSRIVSICSDGLVCTWDARARNVSSNSKSTPYSPIVSAKFSSDGQLFVSGSKDGTLCIWDSHTGEIRVGPIKAHTNQVVAVDFLHDRIVSGTSDGNISVCDARSGEIVLGPLKILPGDAIRAVAYSPNGSVIATVSSKVLMNSLDLWDAHTGNKVLGPLKYISGDIASVQFSPDGARIVGSTSGSLGSNENLVLCAVSDGERVIELRHHHAGSVYSVSYSPDGALIASCFHDKSIIVSDALTGFKLLGPLVGHLGPVHSANFSPDSTRLVSGSE
ncbi:WD40-repeat protein (notchless protein), related protein, partial [Rhizoctonia solani AG-3 Rhs1AP]